MNVSSYKTTYNIQDFNTALSVIKSGGIILYPTDTIWGIGCDATNSDAVNRIFALKRRSEAKSMLSLLPSMTNISDWFENVSDKVPDIIAAIERPTTIILDNPKGVAKSLIADDHSMGIRITQETFSHNLAKELGRPLVSTSANISGKSTPAHFYDIDEEIINGVDYVVKYRRDDNCDTQPSAIIKIHNDKITIIRK